MTAHGWFVLAVVLLPAGGFALWLYGQFLRARREEAATVLRKGVLAQAEVVAVVGQAVSFRFHASGWEHPITVAGRAEKGRRLEIGEKIQVRYLPAHPHISVIVAKDG
ncbi:MAG TPA: hypothetical protein VF460_09325 [Burkholderiales bacterium]